jgi:hypothetical protein
MFTAGYKRLTEGGWEAFCLGLLFWGFCFEAFILGFWLFEVGGFWKEKRLLKGKGMLKGK